MTLTKNNIAIFASGSGTNAENIANYFKNSDINVSLVITNNSKAGVIGRMSDLKIPIEIISKIDETIISTLTDYNIQFIILAGFMSLIPAFLIKEFPNKIINIHPALLPKYGGKGMYGHHVHEAVIKNKEKESGITIHYVNEHYDEGQIIFQARCLLNNDSPDSLADKIHGLEHKHYPEQIEKLLS